MSALDALRAAFGPQHEGVLSTDPVELEAARSDRSGLVATGTPLAILHARSEEDVVRAARIAAQHHLPLVPRGAGSGLAGAAAAGQGELVVSTLRMRAVREVSVEDGLAVVEPGILNAELDEVLARDGLWWPPDPASRAISTVGGNIATNAGGLLCAKYGVTQDWVLGVRVVLAGGEVIDVGHRTVKGVTGLDLAALMLGSEGTLGIITEATLKVRSLQPDHVWTVGALLPSVEVGAELCLQVTREGLRPAVMELVGETALRALGAYVGDGFGDGGAAFALVQFDDMDGPARAERVAALVRAHGGTAEVTGDPARSEALVQVRRQLHFALEAAGHPLVEDIAVPRSKLAEMFALCEAIGARHGVVIATTAHAGDGNLHPTFVMPDPVPTQAVWDAADEVFEAGLALGGTLTGEHGVGVLKRRWLERELGPTQLRIQRAVKAAFDPEGLLSPGRVFEP